jgi:hypothetical protein
VVEADLALAYGALNTTVVAHEGELEVVMFDLFANRTS